MEALEGRDPRFDSATLKKRVANAVALPEEYTALAAYRVQLTQAEHEMELMKQIPEMVTQRNRLSVQIAHLTKCITASMAGFSQFTAPSNWKLGFFSKPDGIEGGYSLYARAVPAEALKRYMTARQLTTASFLTHHTGLPVFSHFTIHSPDATAFTDVAPIPSTPRSVDPIIIGWVDGQLGTKPAKARRKDKLVDVLNFSGEVREGEGFLIAAWDLATDLAFAQQALQ